MNEDLKARIIACLDVTDILDILGWETVDLIEVLEEYIEEQAEEFERACR
jgi:imidazole glycerol phosphate synthase subunit HisF